MRSIAILSLGAALGCLGLAGCSETTTTAPGTTDSFSTVSRDDGSSGAGHRGDRSLRTYEIIIENLTTGQPFSPPVAATHTGWNRMIPRAGKHATPGLEAIAEDGDNTLMFNRFDGAVFTTEVVAVPRPVLPREVVRDGLSSTLRFEIQGRAHDRFSFATMLICTNDGFTGLRGVKLPVHGERVYYAMAYDAGTERNTERSVDIVDACSAIGPVTLAGDPNGNEDEAVDTRGRIQPHPGIRGTGDLLAAHGWGRGPVARVTIRPIVRPLRYRVTVENLTTGQPFSPAVVATHDPSIRMFRYGRLASSQIEAVAEDGNPEPLYNALSGLPQVTEVLSLGVPLTPIGVAVAPFESSTTFEIAGRPGDVLSLVTMLICTNDGFTGLSSARLPRRGSRSFRMYGFDAGTEENTERSEDIVDACSALGPVPLAGDGNGNEDAAVDSSPHRRIRRHPGIAGGADLGREHSWRGPVGRVTVTVLGASEL